MDEADRPTLAFSTLACPEWDATTVVEQAAAAGYDAVEWRGGTDGTVRTTWSRADRRRLRRQLADAGVGSIAITAYTTFISGDRRAIAASVDDAVAHAELAGDLGAPSVRVFLGVRDNDGETATTTDRAVEALQALLDRVRALGVGVAIEPHDDHVRAASIAPILAQLDDPLLGVVWDIGNAWAVGEPPGTSLEVYAGRIRYIQVKDGTGRDDSWRLCRLGEGDVPIVEALSSFAASTSGRAVAWPPISLEWERAWHPELAPASVILAPARQWLAARIAHAIAEPPGTRS